MKKTEKIQPIGGVSGKKEDKKREEAKAGFAGKGKEAIKQKVVMQ